MKELLLLRHAKSSWADPGQNDHDRPLNSRGKRDAPRMGRLLRSEGLVPCQIVSSTARRARKTAKAVAKNCGYEQKVHEEATLYHASPEQILAVIRGLDDAAARVLVVGHNPGMEEVAEELSASICRFPTATLAYFRLNIDSWEALSPTSQTEFVGLWRPKELPRD
jgi:phosphohistidine phosphatase